ncbi:MAG: cytochrome c [Candidatus Nitrohelix vancouverensis]|uniref:Cytochrome c n=1 Tax=Candidatus Nitrohelix vancouverensis TaxID=2705534 RepID=A0A7T0BZX1_9BACT|nr:MAG: cytochrome c [Candidatus Nitrohelix vancouverensis]
MTNNNNLKVLGTCIVCFFLLGASASEKDGDLDVSRPQGPVFSLNPSAKMQGTCPQKRNTRRAPPEYMRMGSPVDDLPVNFRAGEALYHLDAKPKPCKDCHGVNGNGKGPEYKRLAPEPRNFHCKTTMNEISDGQMFWIIQSGSFGTAMPAYKELSDEEIWQLILYIRHFTK